MIAGFAVLSYLTVRTYTDAPPIPDRVEDASGRTLFTSDDILRGQEVFLKYGLMEHGTLWGHGAYLGPDYSAETVHEAVEVGRDTLARARYGRPYAALEAGPAAEIADAVRRTLKENRYDPATGTLRFTEIEAAAFAESRHHWGDYFSGSDRGRRFAAEVHPRAHGTRRPGHVLHVGGLGRGRQPAREGLLLYQQLALRPGRRQHAQRPDVPVECVEPHHLARRARHHPLPVRAFRLSWLAPGLHGRPLARQPPARRGHGRRVNARRPGTWASSRSCFWRRPCSAE